MAPEGQQGATPSTPGATPGSADDQQQDQQQQDQQQGDSGDGQQQQQDSGEPSRALANARAAAKRAAEERDAARAELQALRDKDLPEAERSKKRLEELEEENRKLAEALVEQEVRQAVLAASTKLGVIDPDVVLLLLREDDSIDFNPEGKPTNVEAAIKDLLKQKPYLSKAVTGGADAGAGTRPGASPGGGMNDLIRRAAGRT